MKLAENLMPLKPTMHITAHLWKWHWHTDRPPTEDEVTLRPSDQDSPRGALGLFPGTRVQGHLSPESASGE